LKMVTLVALELVTPFHSNTKTKKIYRGRAKVSGFVFFSRLGVF